MATGFEPAECCCAPDLDLLEDVLESYQSPMAVVQDAIIGLLPGIEPTARLKTSETIRDKLSRIHVRLTQMEDIAGVRIVKEMDRAEQDSIVRQLQARFPDSRVVDRREQPTHGYRAVHLVVKLDGKLIEVQVRTHFQDVWAQVVEKLGDLWGRQIRYGEPPRDPETPVGFLPDGDAVTRGDFWAMVQNTANSFDGIERAALALRNAEELLGAASDADREGLQADVDRMRGFVRDLNEAAEVLVENLPSLANLLGSTIEP